MCAPRRSLPMGPPGSAAGRVGDHGQVRGGLAGRDPGGEGAEVEIERLGGVLGHLVLHRGRLGVKAEGWVAVGDEEKGVAGDAGLVAHDADDEVEEGARVLGGDDDHDPAENDRD